MIVSKSNSPGFSKKVEYPSSIPQPDSSRIVDRKITLMPDRVIAFEKVLSDRGSVALSAAVKKRVMGWSFERIILLATDLSISLSDASKIGGDFMRSEADRID